MDMKFTFAGDTARVILRSGMRLMRALQVVSRLSLFDFEGERGVYLLNSQETHGKERRHSLRHRCVFDVGTFSALLETARINFRVAIDRSPYWLVVHSAHSLCSTHSPVEKLWFRGVQREDDPYLFDRCGVDQCQLVHVCVGGKP